MLDRHDRWQPEFPGRRRLVRAPGQSFGDLELHDFRDCRSGARRPGVVDRGVVVLQCDLRAHGHLTEVDDQVVPLGRRDQEVQHLQRGTEALIGTDQPERQCGLGQYVPRDAELQSPVTFVRGVENAQPVASRLDGQERVRLPVDDGGVRTLHLEHGVSERAVPVEGPVLQDEGDLEFVSRQPQPLVGRVTNEVDTGQPRVDIEAGHRHGMIVVPEHRRTLAVGVGADRFVALDPARIQSGVRLGVDAVRAVRLQRQPVGLRRGETAVLVYDVPHADVRGKRGRALVRRGRDRGELGVPFAQEIDHELEQMGSRQLVAVSGDRRAVLGRADGRTEIAHADRLVRIVRVRRPVTPRGGQPEVPVEPPGALPHRDVVVISARIGGRIRDGCHRPGQRVNKLLQRGSCRHPGVRIRRSRGVLFRRRGGRIQRNSNQSRAAA